MKHTRKKTAYLMLALLMIIAALLGALYYLSREDAQEPGAETPPAKATLFSCAREELISVTVTPPSGKSYTLDVKNGSLVLPHDPSAPVRALIAENILSALCTVIAEDKVLDTSFAVADLAAFGLETPVCAASFTLANGDTHRMFIGSATPLGIPYRYMLWDEDPAIYLISADVHDAFSYELAALRDVTQPVWDAELWDRVEISGENRRQLIRTDLGWQLTAPFSYPLDSTETDNFLAAVESIGFANYVADAKTADLSLYGLDAPRLTLTLQQAASRVDYYDEAGVITDSIFLPDEEITLQFGTQIDDYYVYCLYLDTVYTATLFQTGFLWDEDITSLLDRTPLDVPITQLKALTVTRDGADTVYTFALTEQLEQNGDLKTDGAGNVLWDVHVRKNGESMDADTFLNWYAQLQRIAPESTLPEGAETADSVLSLTFEGEGFVRTAHFLPIDPLHDALSVNGHAAFYLSASALDSLLQLP
ncbi:MAG: DUF4340 domain-containing protein [Clostridiales bacterium]|nr:DUF4340 domain-containing protein [Clostridiales bacterium]